MIPPWRVLSSIFRLSSLTLLVALVACGKSSSSKSAHPLPSSALVSKAEPGQPGGRLVLVLAGNPKTFNPILALDGASEAITRLLFASLVNLDWVTQEPMPGLAQSWSVAADQKTWTLQLRPQVRWSDGQPFTADDVLFTWNEIMYNPALNRLTFDLFRINGKPFEVSKLDDLTVRVITPEVFAPFLEFFGGIPILPKHALGTAVKANQFAASFNPGMPPEKITGCGAYRLKEFRSGKFTLLERNPEYWVADKQGRRLPYFDEIMFTVGGGRGTEAMLFLNGKSDACESLRGESFEQFKQAAKAGRFQVVDLGSGTERDFVWFNQNTGTAPNGNPIVNPAKLKWFRNRKFRQAVSCAIDRERLAREVHEGHAHPSYGFISAENKKWNNPDIPRYSFDPARARTLLAEINMLDRNGDGVLEDGEGNLVEFTLQSNTGNPAREKAGAMIEQDLRKAGLRVTFTPIPYPALIEKINQSFDYESALMGLGGGAIEPASQINVLKSTEELHQWFPFQKTPASDWEARIDFLMDAQMRTLDFAQRKKDFNEVQAILAEELPMIYTVSPISYAAIRSDVANLRPSILTPYRLTWNLEELYFKKN
jgi:peptide/nickel transport system substrate-binding protein